jgi:hypothetical protein
MGVFLIIYKKHANNFPALFMAEWKSFGRGKCNKLIAIIPHIRSNSLHGLPKY